VGDVQLLSGVETTSLAPQPFAVDEMRASELSPNARALEPFDGLAVETLGILAFAQERTLVGANV
jgi:hypothetical protein